MGGGGKCFGVSVFVVNQNPTDKILYILKQIKQTNLNNTRRNDWFITTQHTTNIV